jgi:hypothetical protein
MRFNRWVPANSAIQLRPTLPFRVHSWPFSIWKTGHFALQVKIRPNSFGHLLWRPFNVWNVDQGGELFRHQSGLSGFVWKIYESGAEYYFIEVCYGVFMNFLISSIMSRDITATWSMSDCEMHLWFCRWQLCWHTSKVEDTESSVAGMGKTLGEIHSAIGK